MDRRKLSVIVTAMAFVTVLVGLVGYAVYRRWETAEASRTFVVTGQILYKVGTVVRPVGGTDIWVFGPRFASFTTTYDEKLPLVLERQQILRIWHPGFAGLAEKDTQFAKLGKLSPLANMDRKWWEDEKDINCSFGARYFRESFSYVTSTSGDMDGHFWIPLKRGDYTLLVESEVPILTDQGRPTSRTGWAFWDIHVDVIRDMNVISANPSCSPE